jgi:signal transduction histidine kinase
MPVKIRHSLFFRFFWTLVGLGVVPMAISSAFLVASYQVRITEAIGSNDANELFLNVIIQFFLIFIFVLIVATFAAFIISRNISRPLRVLTEAARIIGEGNLKINIKISRKDEIGTLGEFFNDMVIKIKDAQERQEEISRLKSEFITVAAHQLRTPLSVVKWTFRSVLDGDFGVVSDAQKDILGKANIANESMINLVHNLLDAARIEEGRFGYVFARLNFIDFLKSLLSEKQIVAEKKSVKLSLGETVHGELWLNADKERLSIAVGNIIDNAIRYTVAKGSVELNIREEDAWITLSIKDTGVGIAPEDKERLFTKFYRGSNVVHMETEGTGLGLFISRNIIKSHGGEIWFDSEPSKGTTFFIKLPKESSTKSPTSASFESFVGAI